MDYKFINTEYLESVSGGDSEIIREIVNIFREQIFEISLEMRSLFAEKKYTSLGQLAHKAKSSVAIMGMNDLAAMLKIFELETLNSEFTEKYESYITRFSEETKAAVIELDDMVSNLKK